MEPKAGRCFLHVVMAAPATGILRFAGCALLFASVALAQESVPVQPAEAAPPATPTPAMSAVPAATPVTRSERIVSPRVAGLLAAATPRFAVTPIAEEKNGAASSAFPKGPANEIMRLPNFVVREPRVPTSEAVRTRRGLEVYAMNKYLGDPDGFSRGVLNRFTLADAWKKYTKHIPLLNRSEWAFSPEKRALDMYYDDEVRGKMRDLFGLLAIKEPAPAQAVGKPPAKSSSAPGGK
jgi:hypothetical protein